MSKIKIALVLFCLGIFAAPVARGEDEAAKLEQAKQRFAAADADLNKTFQEVRSKLSGNALSDLRDRQRE